MLDYALLRLVDGISLPGVVLIVMPLAFLHWWITKKRWILAPLLILFMIMSLPFTGKALLYPLEIGQLSKFVKVEDVQGKVDAVVVLSTGLHFDRPTGFTVASTSTFSRVKRGELLARKLAVPLIISGVVNRHGPKTDQEILPALLETTDNLLFVDGANGTSDHAHNVKQVSAKTEIKRIAIFVTGIHAYRTAAVFEKAGFDVPFVLVGAKDAVFRKMDIIPSFKGFFYWKHALKEYAGLLYYYWNGEI